jgi:hypothetical protein
MADTNDKITSGILGLGGAPVPKEADDPTTAYDAESEARRRARMHEDMDQPRDTGATDRDHAGATGIDMGAGGEGTGVSGK